MGCKQPEALHHDGSALGTPDPEDLPHRTILYPKDLAKFFGCSTKTIHRRVLPAIPHQRVGPRIIWVRREAVIEYLGRAS